MFDYTADKSLSGDSSPLVNLVFTSCQSTLNSKLLHAVATSGRNEVFRRRHGNRSCLGLAHNSEHGITHCRVTRRSAQHATAGIAVSGDVRYWMSVSEWLPSVIIRDDRHADVDDRLLPRHSGPPHPPRVSRSPGRNRQKIEQDDNCYNSSGCVETHPTAGRGVSNAGPAINGGGDRTGTRHAANEVAVSSSGIE